MFKKYLLILKSFILKKMIIDLIQFILSLLFIDLPLEDTINKFLDDESSKNKTEKILNKEEIIDKIKEQHPGVESEKIEKLVENVEKKVDEELQKQKLNKEWKNIIMCIIFSFLCLIVVDNFFFEYVQIFLSISGEYFNIWDESLILEKLIRISINLFAFIKLFFYFKFLIELFEKEEESKNQEKKDDSEESE